MVRSSTTSTSTTGRSCSRQGSQRLTAARLAYEYDASVRVAKSKRDGTLRTTIPYGFVRKPTERQLRRMRNPRDGVGAQAQHARGRVGDGFPPAAVEFDRGPLRMQLQITFGDRPKKNEDDRPRMPSRAAAHLSPAPPRPRSSFPSTTSSSRGSRHEVKAHGRTMLPRKRLWMLWQCVGNVAPLDGGAAEIGAYRVARPTSSRLRSSPGSVTEVPLEVIDTFAGHSPGKLSGHDSPVHADEHEVRSRRATRAWSGTSARSKQVTVRQGDFSTIAPSYRSSATVSSTSTWTSTCRRSNVSLLRPAPRPGRDRRPRRLRLAHLPGNPSCRGGVSRRRWIPGVERLDPSARAGQALTHAQGSRKTLRAAGVQLGGRAE